MFIIFILELIIMRMISVEKGYSYFEELNNVYNDSVINYEDDSTFYLNVLLEFLIKFYNFVKKDNNSEYSRLIHEYVQKNWSRIINDNNIPFELKNNIAFILGNGKI